MPNLFRDKWPFLWTPNADAFTGDVRGLLRADNLTLEEDGSIGIIRGTARISHQPMVDTVTQLYSKTMNLYELSNFDSAYSPYAKVRYAVVGGYVLRNWSPTQKREDIFDLALISGVSPPGQLVGFGFGFGHVWITYGDRLWKDTGFGVGSAIGLPEAQPPFSVTAQNGEIKYLSPGGGPNVEDYTQWEYHIRGDQFITTATDLQVSASSDTNTAVVSRGYITNFHWDTSFGQNMNGQDIFEMTVRTTESVMFKSVKLILYLKSYADNTPLTEAADYYYFEWDTEGTSFVPGTNEWSRIACKREDFKRQGSDSTLDWRHIGQIRVEFALKEYNNQPFGLTNMFFRSSTSGPLNGAYSYIQVDVNNNGFFLERSIPSASSVRVDPINATVLVKPSTVTSPANEVWIYRYNEKALGDYYLVKKVTGTPGFDPPSFTDDLSDKDALELNQRLDHFSRNLPVGIIGMECNWKGRNWYITQTALYPSNRDNPSTYDFRFIIETANKNVETNYFITRLSNDVMILGTSGDFYEITGTGGIINQDNIDFFDITIRPLGIKSPPIAADFVVREGNLFYLAADGIRMLSGSACVLITQSIDLLFKGHARHFINPVRLLTNLRERYYLGISKNRLYFSTVQEDNRRALYVYSFEDKNWRYEDHQLPGAVDADSIMAMWVEDDDTVIYSSASYGDKYIRKLDVGTKLDNSSVINFRFQTVADCNEQPRNRKDSFTLKIVMETGGVPVDITLLGFAGLGPGISAGDTSSVFTVQASALQKRELQWPIYDTIGVTKYYQLEIAGASDVFKIYNWSIDYDARPEQLSYLRIAPTNFGIAGRKRINALPFIIDTLDHIVSVNPILDGVIQATQPTHSTDKQLQSYRFTAEATAFNVGMIIYGGLFEFYEMVQPREVELLPDQLKFKWIPYSNLGTASRKRFIQYAIIIDTQDQDCEMTPLLDGVRQTTLTFRTARKQTIVYTFDHFAIGTDIACELSIANDLFSFEYYGVALDECVTEKLPAVAKFVHIPATNFGTTSRKRMQQFAFVLDTLGNDVIFQCFVDGFPQGAQTFNTNMKKTCIFTFDLSPAGIDVSGTLQGANNFHFYGVSLEECVYEKLPPVANHIIIPYTNFNTTSRKRFRQIAIIIDTLQDSVSWVPVLDGVALPTQTINTYRKQTIIFTPDTETIGIELGGYIQSNVDKDFEFYGIAYEECVYEKLPPIASHIVIPYTNFNTTSRKRFRQFAITIDTRGNTVDWIPVVDGTALLPQEIRTERKQTVIYTPRFNDLNTGIDVGGTLVARSGADFEFYGINYEESVYEKLPPLAKFLNIATTNYGIAARKRIRTIPFVINTLGYPVSFAPIVDGQQYPPMEFTTTDKSTVLYYFLSDNDSGKSNGLTSGVPFGIDYGGILAGTEPFEFYELLKPENVETLPVGKKFDQFGPVEFSKVGKIREVSIRVLHTGNLINFIIYASDNKWMSGSVMTIPNQERTYSLSMPKGVNPNIFRMELSSDDVFHRFDCAVKVNIDGAQTENKWVKIK
jgi:hypothetical protein